MQRCFKYVSRVNGFVSREYCTYFKDTSASPKVRKKIKPEIFSVESVGYWRKNQQFNFQFNCQSLVVQQDFLLESSQPVISQIAGRTVSRWRRVRYTSRMDKGNHVQNIKETIWKGNIQGILYIFAFLNFF